MAGQGRLTNRRRYPLDMELLSRWRQQAASCRRRIVLADAGDDRVIEAARILNDDGLAHATVIDDPANQLTDAAARYATKLDTPPDLDDPLAVAVLLVAAGDADGCIAGATRPTADVLRAGLRILGTTPGMSVVSSCFVMVLSDGTPLVFGDCAVVPDPDAEQLASIAIACAKSYRLLIGEPPRVAMLSFATKGSAQHPRVDKVRSATERVRDIEPDLAIDGELQFDAAWVAAIGESKAPGSSVAGNANVFVFPDLDSGNIAYKITERLAGATAIGPVLQGMNGVLHDLSRGCSVDDIVNLSVLASLQANT